MLNSSAMDLGSVKVPFFEIIFEGMLLTLLGFKEINDLIPDQIFFILLLFTLK